MEVKKHNVLDGIAGEIISNKIEFDSPQSALEIIVNFQYNGMESVIIHASNIIPGFFDLHTGIAGEILQKFSTYRARLAIVDDFSKFTSKSLHSFIYESNKGGRIFFVESVEEAVSKLSR